MLFTMFLGGRSRKLMLIRFGLLGVFLVVAFAFHLSGAALLDLRIARVLLLVAFGVGFAVVSRRRRRDAGSR